MTLEAAATVVLAGVVLGEDISPAQAFGGAAILAAAGVIAHSHRAGGSKLTRVGQPVEPLSEQVSLGGRW